MTSAVCAQEKVGGGALVVVVMVVREGSAAGYLSVERGGVGESGWEGWRQLCRVQWV